MGADTTGPNFRDHLCPGLSWLRSPVRKMHQEGIASIKLRLLDIFIRFEWLDDLTKRLEILSIRVHCLALGSVDPTSSAGKLTMGVINAFAQWPSASSVTSEPYPARVRYGPIPS